jgi:predicted phosphoribosyltransferase
MLPEVVAAASVASPEVVHLLRRVASEVVCPMTPEWFAAVGQWYDRFDQLTDEAVRRILSAAQDRQTPV